MTCSPQDALPRWGGPGLIAPPNPLGRSPGRMPPTARRSADALSDQPGRRPRSSTWWSESPPATQPPLPSTGGAPHGHDDCGAPGPQAQPEDPHEEHQYPPGARRLGVHGQPDRPDAGQGTRPLPGLQVLDADHRSPGHAGAGPPPHHSLSRPHRHPRRCSNTNRRIVLDTAVDTWREQLAERTEVSASVASRRPTKVLPKPRSPQTDRVLRGRDQRGAIGRRAEWAGVLYRVRQTDQLRRAVPQDTRSNQGPEVPLVPLTPRQALAKHEGSQLTCEHCGATEPSLADAVASGWCRITRRAHCGRCATRYPAWTRTAF